MKRQALLVGSLLSLLSLTGSTYCAKQFAGCSTGSKCCEKGSQCTTQTQYPKYAQCLPASTPLAASLWSQCAGGVGYAGPTTCYSDGVCTSQGPNVSISASGWKSSDKINPVVTSWTAYGIEYFSQCLPKAADTRTCASTWCQCGGQGYVGPTCCQAGSVCVAEANNRWYSRCMPLGLTISPPTTTTSVCPDGSAPCGVQKLCCTQSETCYIQHPDPAHRHLWEGQCIPSTLTPAPTPLPTIPPCSPIWGQCGGTDWAGSRCCSDGNVCVAQAGNPLLYSQCLPKSAVGPPVKTTAHNHRTTTYTCSPLYGQCGGKAFKGSTCCAPGSICVPQVNNPYYSQCLPIAVSAAKCTLRSIPCPPTLDEPTLPPYMAPTLAPTPYQAGDKPTCVAKDYTLKFVALGKTVETFTTADKMKLRTGLAQIAQVPVKNVIIISLTNGVPNANTANTPHSDGRIFSMTIVISVLQTCIDLTLVPRSDLLHHTGLVITDACEPPLLSDNNGLCICPNSTLPDEIFGCAIYGGL